ncbi:MAG: penicillin-binding protein 2 [Microthrixaceae bacterium]|nr:penicillin-binding protein 2 [Microthrixaceae bacterium]
MKRPVRPKGPRNSGTARDTSKQTDGDEFLYRRRLVGLCGVVCIAVIGLLAQMVRLQGAAGADLAKKGTDRRSNVYKVDAQRGSILDRNGVELAVSIPRRNVIVNKENLAKVGYDEWAAFDLLATKIAPFLGKEPSAVADSLKNSSADDRYVVLARNVPISSATKLGEWITKQDEGKKSPDPKVAAGFTFEIASERINPAGESGLRVIGKLGMDGPAELAGIERAFDKELSGTDGKSQVELKSGADRALEGWAAIVTGEGRIDLSLKGGAFPGTEQVIKEAVPGSAVQLTLDRAMQHDVERILMSGATNAGARRGVAIVGKPTTGELLAVASVEVNDETGEMELAKGPLAFSNAYQAGSVFKLVTVASAVGAGAVSADTVLNVPDRITVSDRSYRDHDSHPTEAMTVKQIVAESSNVGTILIAQKLGKERLYKSLINFGFGKKTGISHPAEASGIVPPFEKWTDPDLASSSIGTHESATALQLWAAYNVVANGGMYVPPRLVDAVVSPDGTRTVPKSESPRRVISTETASTMSQILQSVITEGTAKQWTLPGYSIAAKTGTSRMASPKRVSRQDGYMWEDGKYHYLAAFTGFLPANRPQVSITVILDDVDNGLYGSTAAGPIFSQLARLSIRDLGIAPDEHADANDDTGLLPGTERTKSGKVKAAPATRPETAEKDEDSKSETTNKKTTSTTTTTVAKAKSTSDGDEP